MRSSLASSSSLLLTYAGDVPVRCGGCATADYCFLCKAEFHFPAPCALASKFNELGRCASKSKQACASGQEKKGEGKGGKGGILK